MSAPGTTWTLSSILKRIKEDADSAESLLKDVVDGERERCASAVLVVTFVASQEFHGAGRWIVHEPGGNRENKIAWLDSREEAEELARRVNMVISRISGLIRSGK